MRFLPLLLLGLTACASADRLISIPTGRKIPVGTFRLEAMTELSRGRTQEYFAGMGLSPFLELEVRSEYFGGSSANATFDLGYNYVAPIPDISPGISVGVQDALDNTRDGRRFYGAITYRPVFMAINGDIPADFTIGAFLGSHSSVLVGGTVPFTHQFRLLYEHNGIRPAFGLELRPYADLGLRLIYRENDVLGSLQFTRRF